LLIAYSHFVYVTDNPREVHQRLYKISIGLFCKLVTAQILALA